MLTKLSNNPNEGTIVPTSGTANKLFLHLKHADAVWLLQLVDNMEPILRQKSAEIVTKARQFAQKTDDKRLKKGIARAIGHVNRNPDYKRAVVCAILRYAQANPDITKHGLTKIYTYFKNMNRDKFKVQTDRIHFKVDHDIDQYLTKRAKLEFKTRPRIACYLIFSARIQNPYAEPEPYLPYVKLGFGIDKFIDMDVSCNQEQPLLTTN